MAAFTENRDGQTVFGSDKVENCVVAVAGKTGVTSGATGIVLLTPNGTEKVLYISNAGVATVVDYSVFITATT